jgi:hypothetical protein
VRREDLESRASSPRSTPDAEIEELLRARIRNDFTFTTTETDTAILEDASKIRLSSPGAGSGEPGFLVKKPRSYYIADEPTSEGMVRLQSAAIDAKTILQLANQPWPGCALPWKVRHISAAGLSKEVLVGHPPRLVTVKERTHKRTRKGKKTRIALRKKYQATKSKEEDQARLAKEKEEADREKRTRRNREKKVKKKVKAQAKKEGGDDGLKDDQVHPDRRR